LGERDSAKDRRKCKYCHKPSAVGNPTIRSGRKIREKKEGESGC